MRSMIFAAVATLALAAAAAHAAPPTVTASTTATKAGVTTTSKTTVKGAKPRTAVSLACSGQADAKGVHGKDRTKFMSSCKKAGGK
jgi:hypothetical protein